VRYRAICTALALVAVSNVNAAPQQSAPQFDIVVVGGSSAGAAAALAAGRMGASVALIEDSPVLGGMLSNGVSVADAFSYESLGGIFEEFRLAVKAHYAPIVRGRPRIQATRPRPLALLDVRSHLDSQAEGSAWEPHVADTILKGMVESTPSIQVFYNTYATGVEVHDSRIQGVHAQSRSGESLILRGKVVIDATIEGDIAAWAGVPYRFGREARSRLEPHAGHIYFFDETGEIAAGSTGRQDDRVMSAGLRLTAKLYPGDAPRLSPPSGYDKARYERGGCVTYKPDEITGKIPINATPIGNELQGLGRAWVEGTHAERNQLYEAYKKQALGYLYFLQTECGLTNVGIADDEYLDNGNVPYRVYVREGRRIQGELTVTEADINPFLRGEDPIMPSRIDAVALGHYPIDAKAAAPKADFATPDKGDGDFFLMQLAAPFQVPFGSIVPIRIDGLLVPVAVSATHVAFSAIRMEPTWMALGQAAGVAAALSLRAGQPVRDVSIDQLQRELLHQRARLVFYWDLPIEHPAFEAVQFLSVKEWIKGDSKRQFRPSDTLTRGEAARWLFNGFDIWPSVSNVHFTDVPPQRPEFRCIESLLDHGLLAAMGMKPRWREAGSHDSRKNFSYEQRTGAYGAYEPDKPISWQHWIGVVHAALKGNVESEPAELLSWARELVAHSRFPTGDLGRRIELQDYAQRADAAILLAAAIDERARRR
jgi:hypothetical protein